MSETYDPLRLAGAGGALSNAIRAVTFSPGDSAAKTSYAKLQNAGTRLTDVELWGDAGATASVSLYYVSAAEYAAAPGAAAGTLVKTFTLDAPTTNPPDVNFDFPAGGFVYLVPSLTGGTSLTFRARLA